MIAGSAREMVLTKSDLDASDGAEREILLLRTKLEVRTWFLRVSIALNMGVVAGIVVKVLD